MLPEASYPAYYLHSREAYEAAAVLADGEVEAAIGERAARHGCAIAVGLVQRGGDGAAGDGRLVNTAVLFARDGRVAARQPKRFLWHFDRHWYAPGEAGAPIALEAAGSGGFGSAEVGLFICSDGRLPEITRELALGGADLLVDCTAWVSSGRDPAALSNPQVDYMLAARAIENGAWIAAADKVGVEAGSIVYAGRSGVVDPSGRWRVQAPSDRPGVVHTVIDLDEATGPPVAPRIELYGAAAISGDSLEDAEAGSGGNEEIVRVAAAAVEVSPSAVALMERVRALVTTLATQGADLVVLPDLARADAHALGEEELLPLLRSLSADAGVMLAVGLAERAGEVTYKRLSLLDRGELIASCRQTHLDDCRACCRVPPRRRAAAAGGDAPRADRPASGGRRARPRAGAWAAAAGCGVAALVRPAAARLRPRGVARPRAVTGGGEPRLARGVSRSRGGRRGVRRRPLGRRRRRVPRRTADRRRGGRASRAGALAPRRAGHGSDCRAPAGALPRARRLSGTGCGRSTRRLSPCPGSTFWDVSRSGHRSGRARRQLAGAVPAAHPASVLR